MYETATVIELDDGWATIRVQRTPACQGCNACSYSFANHMMVGRARNEAAARVGDCVRVEVATRHVFTVAALVYVLPLVAMMGGYGLASIAIASRTASVLGGLVGLAIGMWMVKVLGGRLSSSEQLEPVVRAIIRPNPDREV